MRWQAHPRHPRHSTITPFSYRQSQVSINTSKISSKKFQSRALSVYTITKSKNLAKIAFFECRKNYLLEGLDTSNFVEILFRH